LIDLYQWDQALHVLNMAAANSPSDSFLHLQKARLLVLQAEFQRLCQELDIVRHAPGGAALSPRTRRVFEETIQEIIDSLSADMQADLPVMVKRWTARGEAAFRDGGDMQQPGEDLALQPSDQAAQLSALSRGGDSTQVARLFHSIQSQAGTELLHHSIYAAYALALITSGKDQIAFEQAVEAIQSAIDQHPASAIYHVLHARAAQQLDDWQTALQAMQTALSLWSDEPRWQAKFGEILLFNNQYPEAVLHYMSAIEMEPQHAQHYIDLSQAYLHNGEAGQAISTLQDATKVAPDNPKAYLALAGVYYEQQNFVQAKRNADLACRIAPQQPEPLLLCAQIALKLGDPGLAQDKSETALELVPDDPRALLLLAQAYSDLGDPEQAMEVVETAIPLAADPLPLYLLRAELLAAADDSESLLPELKSIADQYPEEPLVLAPLSKAYADANQMEEAIQAAQQALQRNSGEIPLDEQAQLHHMLGRLLRETGQLDQSIHQLSEAIRIAPQSLNSFLELGLTQEERRQFGPALETYKKAISSYPADSRPYYQAAQLLKSGRDYPAAETMLRKAAERDPDNVEIHRQLAALVALNLVHSRQTVSPEM
jgi:tetratricopeptide (TPR) repeat protein